MKYKVFYKYAFNKFANKNNYSCSASLSCTYFGDPRFAGSNPVEVDGYFFFSGRKNSERISSGRDFVGPESEISGLLKNLKPEKNRPLSKI